ncbi:tetratricopeptide repeat protein [Granulicella sp. dw_53]|uniref:tetratricopeptide repeat protein n=1 Tax=Granulicella sp. dw_53 TaxID=2719792 RepID=UPI001BD4AC53|nr:tetratricopeptide repeat protein [Granulicella sp. dw_53]
MNEVLSLSAGTQHPNGLGAAPDRLDSWKEIASYLKREVRTVQLWEKKEGLPVHRHYHNQLGTVYAFRSEIERWGRQVSRRNIGEPESVAQGVAAEASPAKETGHIRIRLSPLDRQAVSPRHQALCRAIEEKTLTALEQLNPGQLSIISPKTAKFEQKYTTQVKAGTVDYVLRWSLLEDEAGLEVSATLFFSDTGAEEWNSKFRCNMKNFGETPSYIAGQIVQCLWLKIISSPSYSPVAGRRRKSGSREAYLKGRYFWSQRNEEGLRKAIQWFKSAIEEDPQFPLPYSGLADSLNLLSFYEIVSPSEAMPLARQAALKAIELDPALAEAHASLADILLHFDRDWEGADKEYRCAIQCNPGYALSYHWYANLLAAKGQHEAAQIAIMHALEIDPVSPITQVWAGVTSHLARRFDAAIQHYQSALELKPDFIWAHMYLAQALEQKGDFVAALREFETTILLAGGSNCVKAMKAHALAVAGDTSSARTILRELRATPSHKCMPSYDIAATYAALGESDQMAVWLRRACTERNMKLFTLIQDPRFDPLREQTEFRAVVDQMGLTQYTPPARIALF